MSKITAKYTKLLRLLDAQSQFKTSDGLICAAFEHSQIIGLCHIGNLGLDEKTIRKANTILLNEKPSVVVFRWLSEPLPLWGAKLEALLKNNPCPSILVPFGQIDTITAHGNYQIFNRLAKQEERKRQARRAYLRLLDEKVIAAVCSEENMAERCPLKAKKTIENQNFEFLKHLELWQNALYQQSLDKQIKGVQAGHLAFSLLEESFAIQLKKLTQENVLSFKKLLLQIHKLIPAIEKSSIFQEFA